MSCRLSVYGSGPLNDACLFAANRPALFEVQNDLVISVCAPIISPAIYRATGVSNRCCVFLLLMLLVFMLTVLKLLSSSSRYNSVFSKKPARACLPFSLSFFSCVSSCFVCVFCFSFDRMFRKASHSFSSNSAMPRSHRGHHQRNTSDLQGLQRGMPARGKVFYY